MRIILIHLFVFSLVWKVNAQWTSDIRITNNPAISAFSQNNAQSVAAESMSVHVAWMDTRDGNPEIYYKRASGGGVFWISDVRLTNDAGLSMDPAIAMSGSNIYIAWSDNRDGNDEIYLIISNDGGSTWGTATRITNNVASSVSPSISATGNYVYLVWNESGAVQFSYSFSNGSLWSSPTILFPQQGSGFNTASISADGLNVMVASTAVQSGTTVYQRVSTDGGAAWSTVQALADVSGTSFSPSVSVNGQMFHAVWTDSRNGDLEIYYKRSADAGFSWGSDQRLTFSTGDAYEAQVDASTTNVAVVWTDDQNGNSEIYYAHSEEGGLSWGANERLTDDGAESSRPNVHAGTANAFVTFVDNREANYEIYFKSNTSTITNVQEASGQVNFHSYPNPVTNGSILCIDLEGIEVCRGEVTINDMAGKIVSRSVLEDCDLKLDVSLPVGIYSAQIVFSDGQRFDQRLVVN